MANATIFEHNLAGRRPATFFGLAVCLGMSGLGLSYAAPWYFMAVIMLTGAMLVWAIIANPQTGVKLTRSALSFYFRGRREDVSLSDIGSARIWNQMGSGTSALILMKSGKKMNIPAMCINRKFGDALQQTGIPVTFV